MRCPADLLHHFLVVAAVALVRRRATAVAVPHRFDVVAVEGAAGGNPREEDEEGHDVDVPEPLEAQEDGTELEERVTTELVQEYPQVNLITLFINSPRLSRRLTCRGRGGRGRGRGRTAGSS